MNVPFPVILLAATRILYFNYGVTLQHVTETSKQKKLVLQIIKSISIISNKITMTMKTFTHASDTHLVHLFQQGNNEALEVLVNRHKNKIYTSLYILTKDKYLAEDMFQDVFIKIIDTLRSNRYNDEGKFLPWAIRMAHNLYIDYFRKVKRKPKITTSDGEDIFDGMEEIEEAIDKKMVKGEHHEEIRKVIEMLAEEQREVIILRHYADMSFKEIAKLTGCSVNTALGRMRYALQNMRRIIAQKQIAL